MKHPFANEATEKKYAYVIGIAMVVFENGEINTKQQEYLKKLVEDIGLTQEDLNKILKFAKNYQRVKNKVVSVLDTPYKKYCFLMELYNLFYETNEKDANLINGIAQFAVLLDIKDPELDSVKQVYMNLGYKHKQYLMEMRRKFKMEQSFLGESLLEYFTADDTMAGEAKKVVQQEKILKKGEELIITKAYQIMGPIKVLEGARLIFDKAEVELHAPIKVEGGYLEIKHSSFKVSEKINSTAFIVMDTSVNIESSSFDACGLTGIWCHLNGELFIKESQFTNTAYRPCITLWECLANIRKTSFISCRAESNNGGAIYTNSNIEILESTFENCRAYRGAALYRFAAIIPWVKEKNDKTNEVKKEKNKEGRMLELFGQKINFVPIPKSFKRIAYPVILKHNKFIDCKGYKVGVVCAYKTLVVVDEGNLFERCEGQSIFYYE